MCNARAQTFDGLRVKSVSVCQVYSLYLQGTQAEFKKMFTFYSVHAPIWKNSQRVSIAAILYALKLKLCKCSKIRTVTRIALKFGVPQGVSG